MSCEPELFQKRLKRISKNHARLRGGRKAVVTKTGLIVAKPRYSQARFPFSALLMVIAVAFGLKCYIYVQDGAKTYEARVAQIAGDTLPEKFGAWLLQADPATVAISQLF